LSEIAVPFQQFWVDGPHSQQSPADHGYQRTVPGCSREPLHLFFPAGAKHVGRQ
jgi:hypothetical protein